MQSNSLMFACLLFPFTIIGQAGVQDRSTHSLQHGDLRRRRLPARLLMFFTCGAAHAVAVDSVFRMLSPAPWSFKSSRTLDAVFSGQAPRATFEPGRSSLLPLISLTNE